MESFSSTDFFKNWITDRAWSLLKSGKAEATTHERSGRLDKNFFFGELYNKFDLITKQFFSTETAQSVRYGEPLRDRSG